MDSRTVLQRMMRREFGHLLNSARLKVVTVDAVDFTNRLATIELAQGDAAAGDPVPDTQDVGFLEDYYPQVGDLAYMLLGEGAPLLIGPKEAETWHALTLPAGYTAVVGWTAPGYRMYGGQVQFRGACNVAASNIPATKFNLPAGYRPGQKRAVAIPYSNGTAISGHLRFDMDTNGDMTSLLTTPAATIFLMFEGVSMDVRTA
jgi:hypothetical protein